MTTPHEELPRFEPRAPALTAVGGKPKKPSSAFRMPAITHPANVPIGDIEESKLYGGVIQATTTTQLRAILDALSYSYPDLGSVSPAHSVNGFTEFINKPFSVKRGVTRSPKEVITDPAMTTEFLKRHKKNMRYRAAAKAMLNIEDIEAQRAADSQTTLGVPKVLYLGNLTLFAVDPTLYTSEYKALMKEAAQEQTATA